MSDDLRQNLRERSTELCQYEVINHLQEMVLAGKISKDQVNSVLDLLDFSSFADMIEVIQDKYAAGFRAKTLGEHMAHEFSTMYAVKDAVRDWKEQNLIPLIEFVNKESK